MEKGKLILRERDGCAFLDDDDPVAEPRLPQYARPAHDAEVKAENDGGIDVRNDKRGGANDQAVNELKRIAGTIGHMMTREPKNPYCSACNRAKTQRKPKFKGTLKLGPRPVEFGEQVTGDLLIKNKKNVIDALIDGEDGADGQTDYDDLDVSDLANSALELYDRGTQWIDCYPKAARSEGHIVEAMQDFTKPTDNIQQFLCDNGGELESASRKLGWGDLPRPLGFHRPAAWPKDASER